MANCLICHRELDDPLDPVRSRNCGGDCLQCMAECGDPDCMAAMSELEPDETKWRPELDTEN